jgi:hypothetical protein
MYPVLRNSRTQRLIAHDEDPREAPQPESVTHVLIGAPSMRIPLYRWTLPDYGRR